MDMCCWHGGLYYGGVAWYAVHMRTNIQAKGTTLTPSLRQYIFDKITDPLEKFLSDDESAIVEVELELTTKHHKKGPVWRAEVNVMIGKTLLRGEQYAEEAHDIIDFLL